MFNNFNVGSFFNVFTPRKSIVDGSIDQHFAARPEDCLSNALFAFQGFLYKIGAVSLGAILCIC